MKVGLACGGTGGHTFPGLATAEVLRSWGHEVTLWLAGKDIETASVKNWDGPAHTIYAEGFQYGMSLRSLTTARRLYEAYRQCTRLMKDDKPDVMLGMGSYASVGPLWAAHRSKVPMVLHEANVIPGRAVTLLSRRATKVAGSFQETRHYLQNVDLSVTGMPLRKEIEAAAVAHVHTQPTGKPFTILSMGGSRGSRPLNEVVSRSILNLHKIHKNFHVIHLTGQADEDKIRALYQGAGVSHEVHSFVHEMTPIYQTTHLAICRAGAATCAELSAFGVPALLVPYPYAARDHQTANAKAMERIKCADFVPESDLDAIWLTEYLEGCMNTPARLERMSTAARSRSFPRAAERLARLTLEAGGLTMDPDASLPMNISHV